MTNDMAMVSRYSNYQNVEYGRVLLRGESLPKAVDRLAIGIDVSLEKEMRQYGAALFIWPEMLGLVCEEHAEALKGKKVTISLLSRKNFNRIDKDNAEDFAIWSPEDGSYEVFIAASLRRKDLQELQHSDTLPLGILPDLFDINVSLAAAISLIGEDDQSEDAKEKAVDEAVELIHYFEDAADSMVDEGEDLELFAAYPLALTTDPEAVNQKEVI